MKRYFKGYKMISTNYAIYKKEDQEIFIKDINKLRLDNKNKWLFLRCEFDNKHIEIKLYNTWLQVYKVDGINYSNCMDRNIKQFKDDLARGIR